MNKYTKQITSIAIVIGILIITGAVSLHFLTLDNGKQQPKPVQTPVVQQVTPPNTQELWQDVNTERAKASLRPLTLDTRLNTSAQSKCEIMAKQNVWAHNLPDGRTPLDFIKTVYGTNRGFSYAENISYGWPDSQSVVNGWMGSEGHKKNILNATYVNVGYGVCKTSNYTSAGLPDNLNGYLVVQHFASAHP